MDNVRRLTKENFKMNNWVKRKDSRMVCYINYKEDGIPQILKAEMYEKESKERELKDNGCTDIFIVYRWI